MGLIGVSPKISFMSSILVMGRKLEGYLDYKDHGAGAKRKWREPRPFWWRH